MAPRGLGKLIERRIPTIANTYLATDQAVVEAPAESKPDFQEQLDQIRDDARSLQGDVEYLVVHAADLRADLEALAADFTEADCDAIASAIAAAQQLDWAAPDLEFSADEVVDWLDEAAE